MKKIYVIHENDEWLVPLRKEFERLNLPYEEWFLAKGTLDLTQTPPEGVFYNRMSASSHTRDHRYAAEYTAAVLAWLEAHGRRVVNNSNALKLQVSKVTQYVSLNTFGIRIPKTIAAIGNEEIIKATKEFEGAFITKHNRAGKGLGVQKFENVEALEKYVYGSDFEEPVDGITLIQQYIDSPAPFIVRNEFIGGKYYYSVQVNTNTNYNSEAESKAGVSGMGAIAKFLGEELEKLKNN